MNALKKLLFGTDEKTLEVTMISDCLVNGRHCAGGETITLPETHARQVIAVGRAYCPAEEAEADAQREEDQRLIPPPVPKKEMPDSWRALPSCFHKWHELNASLMALSDRYNLIETKLLELVSRHVYKPTPNAFAGLRGEDLAKAVSFSISNGQASADYEKNFRPIAVLKDALVRSHKAVDSWLADNRTELVRARMDCSDHVQEVCGSMGREVRELHAMGFELFNIRIAALGLADFHARNLFRQSADAVKYATIQPPAIQDLRLAWADESGPTYYVDRPVPVMASMVQNWQPIADEVAKLTKQVQSELKAARKASQAA